MQTLTRQVVAGVLTIIPLAVTIWVVWVVVDTLIWLGKPAALVLAQAVRPRYPEVADMLVSGWFQSALALLFALLFLYILGRAANAVIGRRILRLVDRLVEALPLARTIYGATQTLIRSLGGDGSPTGSQVVLLEYPNEHMRAVGFVTRVFPATEARPELAAVYVPTTPNPTSGFVELVPTDRLTWLDWNKNEAMAFIVSGGSMAPDDIDIRWKGTGNRSRS